jgi:23S rRNA pseudouridine2605 synthase
LQRQKENPKAKAKAQRRMVDPQERAELRRKEEKRLDRRKLRPDPDEPMRLNRFIAQAGVCSRREADELIRSGKVKVNGQVCTEMGTKVKPKSDQIEYQGKVLTPQNFVYILLNKPKNMITTMSDPLGRRTVLQAVERATKQRVYPVGRLDRNTTGLLLLTNDGELAKRLTHPSYKVRKLYKVRLDRPVTEAHLQALLDGVELEDGPAQVDKVDYVSHSDGSEVGVEIHLGRNRIVRRLFEHLGYRVEALDRIMIGHLDKKSLPRGKWRRLSDKEVGFLKVMVGSK